MNVNEHTFGDINTHVGGKRPPSTGVTPDALPEVQKPVLAEDSQTGVFPAIALSATIHKIIKRKPKEVPRWCAYRVSCVQEKNAYDYLVGKHIEAHCPTDGIDKKINGERKAVKESPFSNFFFATGTKEGIRSSGRENENLPFLRFNSPCFNERARVANEPVIVGDFHIEKNKTIRAAEADTTLDASAVNKYKASQTARIIAGVFNGDTGSFASYRGRQHIAAIIDGLQPIISAYVPSAVLNMDNTYK